MLTVSENLTKKISKVIHPETVALILKKWTIFIQSVK